MTDNTRAADTKRGSGRTEHKIPKTRHVTQMEGGRGGKDQPAKDPKAEEPPESGERHKCA